MDNLHLYIQPQIESIIDELIFKGYTAESLSTALVEPDWHREIPYRDMKIHFLGKHNITISDWVILVTLITDDHKTFKETLLLQISTTIESRWEIKQRHEQEDFMVNYIPELEVAV